jgi:predicted phage terminase large subunit-like protein
MELHDNPGWTSRVFRSIEPWPERMTLWQQWESIYTDRHTPRAAQAARAFYDANRPAMDAGAGVLWPQREDLYTLMCMRVESGRSAFEREKQNSPTSPEMCEWPEEYFDEGIWFDVWPAGLAVKILALDPSKGADSRNGDYSAFVRLGVDRQGVLYVEADLARRPVPQIIADGVEHYRQFGPDGFGVEANQFQELLAGLFDAEFRRQGMLGVHPWLIHNELNKLVRLRRLGPYLAARRLRLKNDSPGTRLLLDQLRQFPTADHDDGPDALEMALRLAAEMLAGVPSDGLGSRLRVG